MDKHLCDPVIITQHNATDKLLRNIKLEIVKYCRASYDPVIITQHNAMDKLLRNVKLEIRKYC